MAGITTERFWRLTPAEIGIEIEAREKHEEMLDFRAGLICAVIANCVPGRKEPLTPQDFIVQRKPNQSEKKRHWQDIRGDLQALVRRHKESRR